MKIEIYMEMIVQNVLFPTVADVLFPTVVSLWNLNLCVNDSSERPLSNRGIFIAVRIVRVEIFSFE